MNISVLSLEKNNLKIANKMHCWRQILANMFRSMAVSWFIHVKMPYHIRICGLFGVRSSVAIGWSVYLRVSKCDLFVISKSKVIWRNKQTTTKKNKEKPLSRLDKFHAAPLYYKFSAFGVYKKFHLKYTFSWHNLSGMYRHIHPLL